MTETIELPKLVPIEDQILYTPTQRFDFASPPMDPQELYNKLRDAMVTNKGIGLSANQIGLPWSVFVMGSPNEPQSVIGVFNPFIANLDGEEVDMEEGCLSVPNLIIPVTRHSEVRVRYTTYNGVTDTRTFKGISARIFQHEMCHIRGELFFKGISRFKLERALTRTNKRYGTSYRIGQFIRQI